MFVEESVSITRLVVARASRTWTPMAAPSLLGADVRKVGSTSSAGDVVATVFQGSFLSTGGIRTDLVILTPSQTVKRITRRDSLTLSLAAV